MTYVKHWNILVEPAWLTARRNRASFLTGRPPVSGECGRLGCKYLVPNRSLILGTIPAADRVTERLVIDRMSLRRAG